MPANLPVIPSRGRSKGAIYIEAIICLLIFFSLIGAFVHYCLTLHYYNVASNAVTSTLRQVGTVVHNPPAYDNPTYSAAVLTAPSASKRNLASLVKERLAGQLPKSVQVTINPSDVCVYRDANNECHMRVTVRLTNNCVAFCMFSMVPNITVTAEAGFEDPCFRQPLTGMLGCPDPSIAGECA